MNMKYHIFYSGILIICGLLLLSPHALAGGYKIVDIGVLPGSHFPGDGRATAINNTGVVIGFSTTVPSDCHEFSITGKESGHAFRWTAEDGIQYLGSLDSPCQSAAAAISDTGFIVGDVIGEDELRPNNNGAFFWNRSEGLKYLSSLIPADSNWTLFDARGINNGRQIVGSGTHNGLNRAFVMSPGVNLTISATKPIQVVWDADINNDGKTDLVNGKDAAIFTSIEGFEELDNATTIDVSLSFEGKNYLKSKTVADLKQDNRLIFNVTPSTLGDETIVAKVDPFNKITNENNNVSEIVTVKDTEPFSISYIRIRNIHYGNTTNKDFEDTAIPSSNFIFGTYPISAFTYDINRSGFINGSADPTPDSIDQDLVHLDMWRLLTLDGDVAVGMVEDVYFRYHNAIGPTGSAPVGISIPSITRHAVIVQDNYFDTTAHEIGHTFGLGEPEQYVTNPPGNPASGYWVDLAFEIINGYSFMGEATEKNSFYLDNRHVWIDNESYFNLFRQFRTDQIADPTDSLLVAGTVFKNGTINMEKTYYLDNRSIETPISGDYSMITLDRNGKEIGRTNFDVNFSMNLDPIGVIETNSTGFVFTLPFPLNASDILIQHDNKTLIEFNPNVKLLRDGINSIPDYGFINNPEQRRNALNNKIDAIQKMLEKKNSKGAVENLQNDVRDKLMKWLVDYKVENPEQLTKNEVISLVDKIVYRT